MGWELFKNYLIAKEKFKPDFFLYENNKSAAQPIKDQISRELGVPLMHINSALVSAQNRERFYAFNWEVDQPEDRGILLKDILESREDLLSKEKSYVLTASYSFGMAVDNTIERKQRPLVAEPIRVGDIGSTAQAHRVYSCDGKSVTINAGGGGQGGKTGLYTCPATGKEKIVYEVKDSLITIKDKKYPIGLSDGYYTIRKLTPVECERLQTLPENFTKYGREYTSQSFKEGLKICQNVASRDVITKSQIVVTDCATNIIYDCNDMEQQNSLDQRLIRVKNAQLKVVSENKKPRKATVLCTINDGLESEIPSCLKEKLRNVRFVVSQRLRENSVESTIRIINNTEMPNTPTILEMVLTQEDTESVNIRITKSNIDSLVRELSAENSRKTILSTILTLISQIMKNVTWSYVPKAVISNYIISLNDVQQNSISWDILNLKMESIDLISDSQRYKALGNGWTAEVIIHILNGVLKDVPRDDEIVVLSMYDGIGTGRYCLDKMGFTNVKYFAYEINKYAKQIALSNYPDIIQCGDAFDLRHPDWTIGY